MAWFSGIATDYRDFLDKVREFATSINVQTVAINAGGTGYTEGDIVTISGGTSTTAATVEVVAVSGGVVTEVQVSNAGAYSVAPATTGAATTGGTGSGLTLNTTTQAAGWTALRNAKQLFALTVPTITNGGTGYAVDDILTADTSGIGGITAVTEATFRVTAVSGGVITAISIETLGEYSANDGTAIPLTGGGGTNAEILLTMDGEVGEDQLILEGSGGGSDQIFVGVRTYTISGIGARNWELRGMTGFSDNVEIFNQPGSSPAVYDDQSPIAGGAYLPLRDVAFNYWMSIDSYRIAIVVNTGANYHSAYLGFIDRFTTDSEYPYPLLVQGSMTEPERVATSSDIGMGGWPDPIADADGDEHGPGMLRWIDGQWLPVRNGYKNSSALTSEISTTANNDPAINVWPSQGTFGSISLDDEDNWAQTSPNIFFDGGICERNVAATPDFRLEPTPNSGGALQCLFPLTMYSYALSSIIGRPRGLFWVSVSQDGASSATSEDTFTVNGKRYRVFQNVGRSEIYNFFAIEES